jgi:hypothetical protein
MDNKELADDKDPTTQTVRGSDKVIDRFYAIFTGCPAFNLCFRRQYAADVSNRI